MALQEYQRKRSFTRTPEPRGAAARGRKGKPLSFVVQLHHARRRHYDFRLELDGVLRSWAVPKGPSFRPEDKRLAVEVEDHPLSYGSFEGEIPKGNYGAGHVAIYDRGTWTPEGDPHEGIEKGKLIFSMEGEKLRGRWELIRTKKVESGKPQWLLFKKHDAFAGDLEADDLLEQAPPSPVADADIAPVRMAKATTNRKAGALPEWRPPMLATAAESPPTGDDWLHEWKWDGYRINGSARGGQVALYSRNGLPWNDKIPHVVEALRALKRDFDIDGELIALTDQGISDFNALQQALKSGRTSKLRYVVFDLPALDGEDLATLPLHERKEQLRALVGGTPGVLVYSEHIDGNGEKVFAAARQHGLEGILSKRRNSKYVAGRSRDWLKVKAVDTREFIIVGYTEPKGSRNGVGALMMAKPENGKLVYAGRVGTGYSDELLRELRRKLQPLERKEAVVALPEHDKLRPKHVHWVEPQLVAEVIFRGWGKEGLLRQPSFHRLREDRAPDASLVQPEADALPALSSPERVVYPPARSADKPITKQEVFDYYAAVAPRLLDDMGGRLLSIVRCPDGINGQKFFQKHLGKGFGDAIHEQWVTESGGGGKRKYFHVDDLTGLLQLVQMNVIEFHPWGSKAADIEKPDRVIFDLDPDPGVDWKTVKASARELRDRLSELGLQSFPRLTGGKGVHLVVPIAPKYPWPQARAFCEAFADTLATQSPDRYVATMSKAKREGRIFIDWLRNGRGATAIASWSLRARSGATVAMPVTWEELALARTPDKFNLRNAMERVDAKIWDDAEAMDQALPLAH
jgi:bifunctional non-homologous end joining protein LigD